MQMQAIDAQAKAMTLAACWVPHPILCLKDDRHCPVCSLLAARTETYANSAHQNTPNKKNVAV